MKATRQLAPINLEVSQEEAELIALLLRDVHTYDSELKKKMEQMANTLAYVGADPIKGGKLSVVGLNPTIMFDGCM